MNSMYNEIRFIHNVMKANSDDIQAIHERLDRLKGDKKAVDE